MRPLNNKVPKLLSSYGGGPLWPSGPPLVRSHGNNGSRRAPGHPLRVRGSHLKASGRRGRVTGREDLQFPETPQAQLSDRAGSPVRTGELRAHAPADHERHRRRGHQPGRHRQRGPRHDPCGRPVRHRAVPRYRGDRPRRGELQRARHEGRPHLHGGRLGARRARGPHGRGGDARIPVRPGGLARPVHRCIRRLVGFGRIGGGPGGRPRADGGRDGGHRRDLRHPVARRGRSDRPTRTRGSTSPPSRAATCGARGCRCSGSRSHPPCARSWPR